MNISLSSKILKSIDPLSHSMDMGKIFVSFNERNSSYEINCYDMDGKRYYIGSINLIGSGFYDPSQSSVDSKIIAIIEQHLKNIVSLAKNTTLIESREQIIKEYFEDLIIDD